MRQEVINPIFRKTEEPFFKTVKDDSHRNPHEVYIMPPSHVLGCFLCFQIKIDDPWFGLLRLKFLSLDQNRLRLLFPITV